MHPPSIMAFLHHLAAFTLVAAVAVEVATFKPPLSAVQARRVLATDTILGAAATALLIVGLLRVFLFEKGSDYYFANGFFIAKLAAFVLAALISIYPTFVFLSWRRALGRGETPSMPEQQVRRVRMCLMLELTAIVAILLFSPLMADGLGYFG